jgi:hypothetical protein
VLDDFPRGEDTGGEESPIARRRRRRRGRSRLDDGGAEGTEGSPDVISENGEASGNGSTAEVSSYVPTSAISELPAVNGQMDDAPVVELAEADAPAPRAPRRRRRTPSSSAVAEAPTDTTSTES